MATMSGKWVAGLQRGLKKFCCFLCLWDSWDAKKHYGIKKWPLRKLYEVGKQNVKNVLLVNPKKIILPPLHIKLGFVKNFVKALDKEGEAFEDLREKFPKLSLAKN